MSARAAAGQAGHAGCLVLEAPGGRLQVKVLGALTVGWAGRLAAALAARRISVVRGGGARRSGHVWEVELLVEPLDRSVDARALDYLALAHEGHAPEVDEGSALRLHAFSLTRSDAELVVDVEAVDELGFLDRLLRVFALHGLYPHALHLETRGERVRDQFRLHASSGHAPSLHVCTAVGIRLRAMAGSEAP